MRHEIILGGFGGQGVKVLAALLARAADHVGKHAAMYNIYAAAIRGGPIFCTVVVDDEPLQCAPTTIRPTAVLAMDGNTVEMYGPVITPGGVLVTNTSLRAPNPGRSDIRVVKVPTTAVAEALGDVKYTGMVALGALVAATGVVPPDAVPACLAQTLPAYRHGMIAANEAALGRGAGYALEAATAGTA